MELSHYLFVFHHILSNGESVEGKHHLKELSAWHDFDGYTCFIGYKDVTMSLYFHGRFSYDYQDEKHLNEFKSLIKSSFEENKNG